MRRAEHDVDGLGMGREDRGQRVDDVLDALVAATAARTSGSPSCRPRRGGPCSSPSTGTCGMPCGMRSICRRGMPCTSLSSSAPDSLITTSRSDSRASSSITVRCAGFGAERIVCSVVTIGMRSSRSSVRTCAPALPPKIPYSCCTRQHVDLVDVQEVGGAAVRARGRLRRFRIGRARDTRAAGRRRSSRARSRRHPGNARRQRIRQMGRERRDAALARQVIAEHGEVFHSVAPRDASTTRESLTLTHLSCRRYGVPTTDRRRADYQRLFTLAQHAESRSPPVLFKVLPVKAPSPGSPRRRRPPERE